MQDLKRQSNRRPAVRKLRTSPMSVRRNRSNPIPGLSVKLRKANSEPGFKNSWLPSYFVKNEPAFLRDKFRLLLQKLIGVIGLIFILWLAGGSVWIGQTFFKIPLKKVIIKGNVLLNKSDVLKTSGLRPGNFLFDLNQYQIAERLQKHPVIKKADIRPKFPDEIHLFITEYKPIALLKISQNAKIFFPKTSSKKDLVLIGDDQRLLKKMSMTDLIDSKYKKLPLISGLGIKSFYLGSCIDSPVLKRGLKFLKIFNRMAMKSKKDDHQIFVKDQLRKVDLYPEQIHIDISDPLNLKISWPRYVSGLKMASLEHLNELPLTIQMGSRDFGKRLLTFQNIFPVLDKQHPGLKSIDLRYENRVMLVP